MEHVIREPNISNPAFLVCMPWWAYTYILSLIAQVQVKVHGYNPTLIVNVLCESQTHNPALMVQVLWEAYAYNLTLIVIVLCTSQTCNSSRWIYYGRLMPIARHSWYIYCGESLAVTHPKACSVEGHASIPAFMVNILCETQALMNYWVMYSEILSPLTQ